jgi:hypothetical protein
MDISLLSRCSADLQDLPFIPSAKSLKSNFINWLIQSRSLWKGTIGQYAERLHRENPGKDEVRVIGYAMGPVQAACCDFAMAFLKKQLLYEIKLCGESRPESHKNRKALDGRA